MLQLQELGNLPLSFQKNQGQAVPEVKYLARGRGYALYLTSAEAILLLREKAAIKSAGETGEPELPFQERELVTVRKIRLRPAGANEAPEVSGEEELPGRANYFIGDDPAGWHTDIPTYAKVTYRELYPGVDMVYYGNQGQLEWDFVIAPGADPGSIALDVEGGEQLLIDDQGNLVVSVGKGEIRFRKPFAYQTVDDRQQEVAAEYTVANDRVYFRLGEYDTDRALVIDPVLVYSTYLGGTGDDFGFFLAIDGASNAYVTGGTNSLGTTSPPGFPTVNPIQTNNNGGTDVFVTKINAAGTALIYSTYLGGSGTDQGRGIAVDAAGNAYVAGFTNSSGTTSPPGFPTVNPIQANNNGGFDAFVAKINAAGNALVYSTYLGGTGDDFGLSIAIDTAGSAYVTGQTNSSGTISPPGFPTVNPIQANNNGGFDAFVTKINAAGTALVYSTYLGGTGGDFGFGIVVDAAGNAYVAGDTTSSGTISPPGFPTMNPIQPNNNGGSDIFATKINAAGNALVYSTYLGGTGDDFGRGIAVDVAGNAYITGSTASSGTTSPPGFPTMNPIQPNNNGGGDAFVTKINAAGTALVYSTYLGGTGNETGRGIAVDAAGNTYVAGQTDSSGTTSPPGFPTVNPIQPNNNGFTDVFVTKINAAGTALIYSTYLGGTGDDEGFGLAVDAAGNAYVAGFTNSSGTSSPPGFPTVNPIQGNNNGSYDTFVLKIFEPVPVRGIKLF